MTKQINIIAPAAVNGGVGVGTMTAAGNPWTVSDGLADELVNRKVASYVTGAPAPDTYGTPLWSDAAGTKLRKPDGTDTSVSGTGVPVGGTTGQVLKKNSNTDGDASWASDAGAADSAVVHNTGNETIAGTKTFSSAPVVPNGSFANAVLANMPASTVIGNLGGSPAAPSNVSVTALAAALGVTSGGTGQMRAVGMGSSTAVPAATAAVTEMTRITIPGGSLGIKGVARILYRLRRDGSTDAGTFSVHIGSISGTANQVLSFTSFTGSNIAEAGELLLFGNGADQSSVMRQNTGSITALAASASGNATNFAVDTSADWVVIFAGTTGATNNLVVELATATISNPAASSVAGGAATTPQDEAAGRALVQGDSTKVLGSTAATAQAFTIPAGLTTPWETRIEKFGAGNVTVVAPSGITLNGVDAGSTIVTAQYTGVTIRARSATAFYVVA